jgi:hypothetical protein
MSDNPKRKKRNAVYRSPESRARQLAGLANVSIEKHVPGVIQEKVNGQGALAGIPPEIQKKVLDLFITGQHSRAIAMQLGISERSVDEIKVSALDMDSQFRNAYFNTNLKAKLQSVIDGAAQRVMELMPEMSAKDAVLALGITLDKYANLEKNKVPDQLHQHVHLHTNNDISAAFMAALKPPKAPDDHVGTIENE